MRKQRINYYRLSKRVEALEQALASVKDRNEMLELACENTEDLLTQLEIKVKALLAEKAERQALQEAKNSIAPVVGVPKTSLKRSVFSWIKQVLSEKGEP